MEPHNILFELAGADLEGGFLRTHVLHFEIRRDRTMRINPVALRADDFVHEWITRPWNEMVNWTRSSERRRLRGWHEALAKFSGSYWFVQPCSGRPGTWQIAIEAYDSNGRESKDYFFLVTQKDQYDFQMVDASSNRQAGCPGERYHSLDRPTLFPR